MSIDNSNNVYLTGSIQNTAYFDNITLTSNGGVDGYIAKLNSSGQMQWVKGIGGPLNEGNISVTTDPSGNAYVCGRYYKTVTLDDTTLNADTHGIFLWKMKK